MNALNLVHGVISRNVKKGATCIDATAGRGYDTAFLCETVGLAGRVIALDIQQPAIDSTAELLKNKGLSAELHLDSHSDMDKYADENSVDCIVFNLGYLPRGDHSINTRADSTIEGVEKGLKLLKKGGIMCVSVYYGGDSGYDERDRILPFFKKLDSGKYQVIMADFYNWTNDPPIPVFIIKN